MDAITLDQLLVLTTTVDAGSFSGAARALNRAQSAITYTIQRLEDQVGAPLFDRGAYRPVLTSTGRALLPRARRILAEVGLFRSQAGGLVRGLEAEVRLGLSEMVPVASIASALASFHRDFPTVSLRIVRGGLGLGDAIARGDIDLAVLPDFGLPEGIERDRIATIDLVAVAAPGHPLAQCKGLIATDMLRRELQIVLTGPAPIASGDDHGVAAIDSWRVTDLATKHGLLCEGIGWGSMPLPLVATDIAAGRLAVLAVERWDGSDHLPSLAIVVARPLTRAPGQAGMALFAAIASGRDVASH